MKLLVFLSCISFTTQILAQEALFKPVSYKVNTPFDRYHGIKFTCDNQGRMQDSLFYYFIDPQNDTVILFRSRIYNDCLKGSPEWTDESGDLIHKITTYEGGCTVFPSSYYMTMPGGVRMELSALIRQSTYWNEENPALKRMEEFYFEGELDRRVTYFDNGFPKNEYHFVRDKRYLPNWNHYYDNSNNVRIYGACKFYYDNGVIASQGFMDRHSKYGLWKYFDRNRTLKKKVNYHRKDSSSVIAYYSSGKIKSMYSEYRYRTIGTKQHYYESGMLKSFTHFDQYGQQDTAIYNYYENGNLRNKIPCCDYRESGVFESWYDNGSPKEAVKMVDGERVGNYTSWYPNGETRIKGQYNEFGIRISKWNYYRENGRLDSTRNFDVEIDEVAPAEEKVFDTPEDFDKKMVDVDLVDYEHDLPSIAFIGKRVKASRKNSLSVLKKTGKILVKVMIEKNGQASYTILTPLKKKDRLSLERFFSRHQTFDSPFTIMGKEVASVMIMEIEYFE